MPSGIFKITGLPLDADVLQCDVKVEDEKLLTLLREPLKPKKKNKVKAKAAANQEKPDNNVKNATQKPAVTTERKKKDSKKT